MAVLAFFMSILMMIHIFNFAALRVQNKSVSPFLNNWVEYYEGT